MKKIVSYGVRISEPDSFYGNGYIHAEFADKKEAKEWAAGFYVGYSAKVEKITHVIYDSVEELTKAGYKPLQ